MTVNNKQITPKKYNPEACFLLHQEINNKIAKLENIDHKKDLEKIEKSLKNQIETTQSSIMNRIETLDNTIRGNGKIGLEESVRFLNFKIYVLFTIILFLLGFKIFGTNIRDIFGEKEKNIETKQVENVKENNIKNIENNKK